MEFFLATSLIICNEFILFITFSYLLDLSSDYCYLISHIVVLDQLLTVDRHATSLNTVDLLSTCFNRKERENTCTERRGREGGEGEKGEEK